MDPAEGARRVPRRLALRIASGLALAGKARPEPAEAEWPARSVRCIDPLPTGCATDILSRLFCAKMSEPSGRRFAVENLSAAGGTVGRAAIAKAAPDGHTLGLGSVAPLAVAPSVRPGLPYEPARDFAFVSGLWRVSNILICDRDLPVRSVPEPVALLKRNPGRHVHTFQGNGGSDAPRARRVRGAATRRVGVPPPPAALVGPVRGCVSERPGPVRSGTRPTAGAAPACGFHDAARAAPAERHVRAVALD